MPPRVHERPEHGAARSNSSTASTPRRSIIRPDLPSRLRARAVGDYVLAIGRLESVKRADLVVRAMAHVDRPIRLVLVGEGTQRQNVERLIETLGVARSHRQCSAPSMTIASSTCTPDALAVVYPPFDEDYGYVTLEAFLARKPVVTTTDAGGPARVRRRRRQWRHLRAGRRRRSQRRSIASRPTAARARRLGDAGFERARLVTWDGVVEKLTVEPVAAPATDFGPVIAPAETDAL